MHTLLTVTFWVAAQANEQPVLQLSSGSIVFLQMFGRSSVLIQAATQHTHAEEDDLLQRGDWVYKDQQAARENRRAFLQLKRSIIGVDQSSMGPPQWVEQLHNVGNGLPPAVDEEDPVTEFSSDIAVETGPALGANSPGVPEVPRQHRGELSIVDQNSEHPTPAPDNMHPSMGLAQHHDDNGQHDSYEHKHNAGGEYFLDLPSSHEEEMPSPSLTNYGQETWTATTHEVHAGYTIAQVAHTDGFAVGESVAIGSEVNRISDIEDGKLVFYMPLEQEHPIGTAIKVLQVTNVAHIPFGPTERPCNHTSAGVDEYIAPMPLETHPNPPEIIPAVESVQWVPALDPVRATYESSIRPHTRSIQPIIQASSCHNRSGYEPAAGAAARIAPAVSMPVDRSHVAVEWVTPVSSVPQAPCMSSDNYPNTTTTWTVTTATTLTFTTTRASHGMPQNWHLPDLPDLKFDTPVAFPTVVTTTRITTTTITTTTTVGVITVNALEPTNYDNAPSTSTPGPLATINITNFTALKTQVLGSLIFQNKLGAACHNASNVSQCKAEAADGVFCLLLQRHQPLMYQQHCADIASWPPEKLDPTQDRKSVV